MNQKENLVALLLKFPGVGPKQAQRFAYYLMKQSKGYVDQLTIALQDIKMHSKQCAHCYTWFSIENNSGDLCNICKDENRDQSELLLVEKELDIDAIEKTGEYTGKYFVLGGRLPFLADNPKEHIRIQELVSRIITLLKEEENKNLKEIIFALPVNDEGDNTVEYIQKTINQIVGIDKIKISHLARGVSTGLEMEYIDKSTFKYAFNSRN